jgi:glycosyltransferase involved in cell wall biosynthesis
LDAIERLVSPDIDRNLVRRVLSDEFVRGHVELVRHQDNGGAARQTLVVPVFNQESFIGLCLEALAANVSMPSDLVIVLDCCTDASEEGVLSVLRRWDARFQRLTVLRTTYPLFETRCDNLGFLLSRGDYVVEVQSDIQILAEGFDALLVGPMLADPAIFSVSGRAGHWFGRLLPKGERRRRFPVRNLIWSRLGFDRVGYLTNASLADAAHESRDGSRFAQAETVVRGPLCMRRRSLLTLGLLDERNFFLGYDEYDLQARGFALGLRCAYVPMRLNSPLALGSTRQERSGLNLEAYERFTRRPNNGYLTRFLESYRPTIPCRYVR